MMYIVIDSVGCIINEFVYVNESMYGF